MALTNKQEKFASEYVKTDNASEAYRTAYNASKMSAKTINEAASRLLKKSNIAARVKELQGIAAEIANEEFKTDSTELLKHLTILKNSRIDEYVEYVEEGEGDKKKRVLKFKPFEDLTENQLMCIESIKNSRYGIELKLHGKEWTIEKIAKHIGFYEKDNTQKTSEVVIFELPDNNRNN